MPTSDPTDERAAPDVVPDTDIARGQRIAILLATVGRTLTEHFEARLAYADLVGNVPALILCELALRGPLRPRDLMASAGVNSAAMSKQLDHLERLGLVERTFGALPDDRRATIVSLTAGGSRAAELIGEGVEDALDEIGQALDEVGRLIGD